MKGVKTSYHELLQEQNLIGHVQGAMPYLFCVIVVVFTNIACYFYSMLHVNLLRLFTLYLQRWLGVICTALARR